MINQQIVKYKDDIEKLSKDFDIPFRVIATLSLNESQCNPDVKPFKERSWRYFTDKNGKALSLIGGNKEIQKRALEILGEKEFTFQVHAHGTFQVVGSVLRELGYTGEEPPKDFATQGLYAMKNLSKMRDRFVRKWNKQPSYDQYYAMHNGGFGSVHEDGIEDYVAGYVINSNKNELKTI
jgi:hypothetical protein